MVFTGSRDRKGYGRIGLPHQQITVLAHRAAYVVARDAIPSGLCVLHRCDNPSCVNPEHLFLGTRIDNNADMRAKGRDSSAGWFTSERLRGERHPRAKLTDAQVEEIRRRYVPRRVTRRMLAEEYGVSEAAVHTYVGRRGRGARAVNRPSE